MFVAEELRKTNIAEYLLYMWQVEDSIRAAGLDTDWLYDAVIADSERSEQDCQAWRQWYADLADMMRLESKMEQGHLQINENVLSLLTDLHQRLLKSEKSGNYREAYYRTLPFIVEFRAKTDNRGNDELRDCFDMLYGVWILRLQKKMVSAATAQAVSAVSAMISMLAAYYNEDRAGNLDLD